MMGEKTLAEIRAELERVLGNELRASQPPADVADSPGRLAVWESLIRSLKAELSTDEAVAHSSTRGGRKRPVKKVVKRAKPQTK